eukprot:gene7889-biopygen7851
MLLRKYGSRPSGMNHPCRFCASSGYSNVWRCGFSTPSGSSNCVRMGKYSRMRVWITRLTPRVPGSEWFMLSLMQMNFARFQSTWSICRCATVALSRTMKNEISSSSITLWVYRFSVYPASSSADRCEP